jgi:myo-inositol-1(or 4)-monophosphatase
MPIDDLDLKPRLEAAVEWTREAGELILGYYQSAGLRIDRKSDKSPVTEADRGAELLLRERVAQHFPQDGFLGEEHGELPSQNGLRWIVDPIDGTKAFVAGVPLFGTLVGLEVGQEPDSPTSDLRPPTSVLLGVCRFPALDEVIYATSGCGAHWRIGGQSPRPIRVSDVADLSEALFCYTEVGLFEQTQRMDAFNTLRNRARATRGWGDCYGHMLVATGRAEIAADPVMNAWDAAALLPILYEAGGSYTAWNGEPTIHGGDGISVNAALKDEVLRILAAGE